MTIVEKHCGLDALKKELKEIYSSPEFDQFINRASEEEIRRVREEA